jgi:hypothetical protein
LNLLIVLNITPTNDYTNLLIFLQLSLYVSSASVELAEPFMQQQSEHLTRPFLSWLGLKADFSLAILHKLQILVLSTLDDSEELEGGVVDRLASISPGTDLEPPPFRRPPPSFACCSRTLLLDRADSAVVNSRCCLKVSSRYFLASSSSEALAASINRLTGEPCVMMQTTPEVLWKSEVSYYSQTTLGAFVGTS